MAALAVQQVKDDGTAPTFSPVSASDTAPISNGRNTVAIYKNGSGSSVTVTAVVPGNSFFGSPNPDNVITVPAGGEKWIPLRQAYSDGTGKATITTSSQSSVTVAVVQVG